MRLLIIFALTIFLFAPPAFAQSYPTCPTGSPTSCTITVHVTASITPIYAKLNARQYLFLENTGYTFSAGIPVISQNPVFCAIASANVPVANSVGASNVMVIQPGGTYEPPQIVKPQNAFTVPTGDVSCVAPLGDVWLTGEEE